NEQREMTSPLSLVISAFARVEDVRHTLTPQLSTEDNALLLIDQRLALVNDSSFFSWHFLRYVGRISTAPSGMIA
ncbi:hypothetical protein ONQ97_26155, partial [Salmonella enterica subsp. enterica serovar Virginia]|nr:hypothetical protein [Salmonella enterica subsp. enterica serovar Virginia]